jgi:hypothetical protein
MALAIWLVMMAVGIVCMPLVIIVERWATDILERGNGEDE